MSDASAPTVIVPNRPKHVSDPSQLDIPVSPYEVSRNVDIDHPSEHSKEINARSGVKFNRHPARKSVEVRARKYNPKGIHGKYLRLRFPELFNLCRYSVDLIEEMKREHGEPRDCRAWIEDVLTAGVPEDHRQKCVVTKHPGFPAYWALFERIRNPQNGGDHYRLVSIAMTPCRAKDYLSPALQTAEGRWEHMRGEMGDPREFTRRDFELIHEWADSMTVDVAQLLGQWQPTTQNQVRKLRWIALCKKHEKREADQYRERERKADDETADMLDYMFDWLVQAANYGKRHKVYFTDGLTGRDPRYLFVTTSSGYTEKVRKGSKRHTELLSHALELATAAYEQKRKAGTLPKSRSLDFATAQEREQIAAMAEEMLASPAPSLEQHMQRVRAQALAQKG